MTEPATTQVDPTAADPPAPIAAESVAAGSGVAAVTTTGSAPASEVDAAQVAIAPRARMRLLAGGVRVARFAVMVGVFAIGVALGYARFQAVQPAAQTAGAPVTAGVEAPPSVQGLVVALGRNDLEAARSAMAPVRGADGQVVTDPYQFLAGELRAMQMLEVREVLTLSTFVDGPRTATAIIISGRTTQGADLSRHLIVQTINGTIVTLT